MKDAATQLDNHQYFLVNPISSTLTYCALHNERFVRDQGNRYLADEKITPRLERENVASQVFATNKGYLVRAIWCLMTQFSISNMPLMEFSAGLMATGHETSALAHFIERLNEVYCCLLQNNRQVDNSEKYLPYHRIDSLGWSDVVCISPSQLS
jgi:hypothetical protein